MTEKFDFLAELAVFENLEDDELWALSQICDEYEFDAGSVIAYQRDIADSMYFVVSGRLFARAVDERGIVRSTTAYQAGEYFGDVWLFETDVHPATIKATDDGRMLVLQGAEFVRFLEQYPAALSRLEPELDEKDEVVCGLTLEAWDEAQRSRLKADRRSAAISLLPDELVEFQARRSRWHLFVQIIAPAVGLLVLPLTSYLLLAGASSARWIVSLLLVLIFGAWLAFRSLDWTNDYFVITNKHLAHHEFSLRTFRTTVNKIPVDQIQSVEVERPTFTANLFNYGTARITTASQARSLRFDNIDNPRRVEEVLGRLRSRVKALDAGRAQATMRQSIESHFQVDPTYQPVDEYEEEEEEYYDDDLPSISLWQTFIRRYKWRVEENGAITYRKHFFVLAREIGWPVGLGLLLLLALFLVIRANGSPSYQVLAAVLLLGAIDVGWLMWQVEDWRNDTFQLTDRYVIDIDRKPFGFGESRKQAELSNVQNVNSDRPNFLATIFNYGNVIIETAGATADITFENVSHPNQIQSEVFQRRDAVRQRQMAREGENRRKEYSVLLDVYQQAMEQGRIPRRTPPTDQ